MPPPDQRRVPPQLAPQRAFLRMGRRGVIQPVRAHADATDRGEPALQLNRKSITELTFEFRQLCRARRLRAGAVPHIKPIDDRDDLSRSLATAISFGSAPLAPDVGAVTAADRNRQAMTRQMRLSN